MADTSTIILGVLAALVALIFSVRRDIKKTQRPLTPKPPKNKAAAIAREIADKEFQENLDAIKGDLEGDSPADDLARRGDERRRR